VSVGSSEVKVVKPKFKSRDSVSSRFHGTKKLNAVEQVGSQLAETVALTETDMDSEKVVQVEGVEQEFIRCEDLTTSQAKLAVAEPGPGREAPGQQMCETVVAGGGSPRVLELQLGGVLVHPVLLAGEWLLTAAEISRLVPRWHGYNLLVSFLARKPGSAERFQSVSLQLDPADLLSQDLIRHRVAGTTVTTSGRLADKTVLFSLKDIPGILEQFSVQISAADLEEIRSLVK